MKKKVFFKETPGDKRDLEGFWFGMCVTRCKVEIERDCGVITFDESVYGIALGQVALFYDNDKVLGSGFIDSIS